MGELCSTLPLAVVPECDVFRAFHTAFAAHDPGAMAIWRLMDAARLAPPSSADLASARALSVEAFRWIEAIAADPANGAGRAAVIAVARAFDPAAVTPVALEGARLFLTIHPALSGALMAWLKCRGGKAVKAHYRGPQAAEWLAVDLARALVAPLVRVAKPSAVIRPPDRHQLMAGSAAARSGYSKRVVAV